MTGLNIQIPWSTLLMDGEKSVETRSYALPKKYEGVELALIETPGKNRNFKARIIGLVTFSHSFEYPDYQSWLDDYNRHKVDKDSVFAWQTNKPKYGWVVSNVKKFEQPIDAPKQRGIIFTKKCDL